MDYMEIFLKCIEGDIDTSKASELIRGGCFIAVWKSKRI